MRTPCLAYRSTPCCPATNTLLKVAWAALKLARLSESPWLSQTWVICRNRWNCRLVELPWT